MYEVWDVNEKVTRRRALEFIYNSSTSTSVGKDVVLI